jgi:hypothetical protein
MLIFKNCIYKLREIGPKPIPPISDFQQNELFDPYKVLTVALTEEKDVIDFLERQPKEYWPQDSKKFYPYSHKMGNYFIFDNLLNILKEGLDDLNAWDTMNTYHFCFLYDVILRFSFNYNHDNEKGRLAALPELKNKPFKIELFIKNYFFNTVFLLNEDQYNSLTREKKTELGYDCPFQFAVINGLTPTKNEMELQSSSDYPYSIYV